MCGRHFGRARAVRITPPLIQNQAVEQGARVFTHTKPIETEVYDGLRGRGRSHVKGIFATLREGISIIWASSISPMAKCFWRWPLPLHIGLNKAIAHMDRAALVGHYHFLY